MKIYHFLTGMKGIILTNSQQSCGSHAFCDISVGTKIRGETQ